MEQNEIVFMSNYIEDLFQFIHSSSMTSIAFQRIYFDWNDRGGKKTTFFLIMILVWISCLTTKRMILAFIPSFSIDI